ALGFEKALFPPVPSDISLDSSVVIDLPVFEVLRLVLLVARFLAVQRLKANRGTSVQSVAIKLQYTSLKLILRKALHALPGVMDPLLVFEGKGIPIPRLNPTQKRLVVMAQGVFHTAQSRVDEVQGCFLSGRVQFCSESLGL